MPCRARTSGRKETLRLQCSLSSKPRPQKHFSTEKGQNKSVYVSGLGSESERECFQSRERVSRSHSHVHAPGTKLPKASENCFPSHPTSSHLPSSPHTAKYPEKWHPTVISSGQLHLIVRERASAFPRPGSRRAGYPPAAEFLSTAFSFPPPPQGRFWAEPVKTASEAHHMTCRKCRCST